MSTERNCAVIPRLAAEIEKELRDLGTLAQEMSDARLRFRDREPDGYDLRAISGILQDFYTGIERVFVRVEEEVNGGLPAGEDWHKQLLTDMALEIPGIRPPMVSESLAAELDEYLRFRHLARHTYGFRLSYDRMARLVERLELVFADFRAACVEFMDYLKSLSKG
ncbi:MAG: hypothetical protein AUJ92_08960 [Armatimonadetes bacterium CG2_30_59_28]|nr:MAG: hypothetical protein AUJ92_08960 [Armatimonadetes bacterium CG2_30_59_28]